MVRHTSLTALALVLVAACSGGGGSKGVTNPNPGSPKRTMSARIDGVAWTAINIAAGNANGALIISGARGTDQGVAISASLIQGTGTQTIGRTSAAQGIVSIASTQWAANSFQGSGSVTLTLITATRAVGTFTLTAPAVSASTFPATKTVTSGAFDVEF
jgi:uncharacterized protein DUF6252